MKCPHCNVAIHEILTSGAIANNPAVERPGQNRVPLVVWTWQHMRCPECLESIIYLNLASPEIGRQERFLAFPPTAVRPIAPEVVDPYRQDFAEACAVLALSPKASAALSRRCLQAILRDKAHTKSKDLFDQIEEVITLAAVPPYIAGDLHAVRVIGNIGAYSGPQNLDQAIS